MQWSGLPELQQNWYCYCWSCTSSKIWNEMKRIGDSISYRIKAGIYEEVKMWRLSSYAIYFKIHYKIQKYKFCKLVTSRCFIALHNRLRYFAVITYFLIVDWYCQTNSRSNLACFIPDFYVQLSISNTCLMNNMESIHLYVLWNCELFRFRLVANLQSTSLSSCNWPAGVVWTFLCFRCEPIS